jgi:transcription elongation factor SPT5
MSSTFFNLCSKREVTQQQGGYTYQSEFFDKEGYLEKSMKIISLEIKKVNPTLEEITKFSGGAVNDKGEDLSMLANANVAKESDFQTGEKVIVLSGEMKNVPGTVHSVENGVVTIIPDKAYGLGNYIKYTASQLAKRFVEGDHAKVINGVHKDESGLVLKVENNVVTLLSDTSLKPLEVFSKDLRTANEVSSITTTTALYDLYDLIQLSYLFF